MRVPTAITYAARVSPLLFKHINFLGRYAFDLPQAIADGALRPLRNPNSE